MATAKKPSTKQAYSRSGKKVIGSFYKAGAGGAKAAMGKLKDAERALKKAQKKGDKKAIAAARKEHKAAKSAVSKAAREMRTKLKMSKSKYMGTIKAKNTRMAKKGVAVATTGRGNRSFMRGFVDATGAGGG